MRFLFVPVNYNSYDSLNAYIKAVGRALKTTDDKTIQVDIHVIHLLKYPDLSMFVYG